MELTSLLIVGLYTISIFLLGFGVCYLIYKRVINDLDRTLELRESTIKEMMPNRSYSTEEHEIMPGSN